MDVSGHVSVTRGGYRFNRATGQFVQLVTLKNQSTTGVTGPVSLVVDNLSINASLVNGTGTTSNLPPIGSPYVNANLGVSGVLMPGQSVTLTLEFNNPSMMGITYTTRILAGPGLR